MKLTNMITGEKNRAQNCLTVSNLKLASGVARVRALRLAAMLHKGTTLAAAAVTSGTELR